MDIAKAIYAKIQHDDALGAAAELAFRFMFALFPLLIFLAALSSYVAAWLGIDNPTQDIIREAGDRLPDDAASLLETQLSGIFDNRNPGLLTVTALTALWAASSGTKAVMKNINVVYEVEETRPFVKKQAVGVGLTIVGGLVFLGGTIILMVGPVVGDEIAQTVGLGDTWGTFVNLARIPIVLLLLAVAVALVYWSAPNAEIPLRWFSPGAAVFVILWLAATLAFGFYVANFANYNATYGSLGGVIILMTWLYLTSFLLLLGAELNVLAARRATEEERGTERAEALVGRNGRSREAAVHPGRRRVRG